MTESDGTTKPFRFAYDPGTIRFGRGSVQALEAELDDLGAHRAIVVSGRTVGTTDAVIDPVESGLGEAHVGTFARTTPDKRLETALEGRTLLRSREADSIVALGGGSSIDVAKAISALSGDDRSDEEVRAEFRERRTISVPEEGLAPIVAVPTTLAGADLTIAGGLTDASGDGDTVSGGLSHPALRPAAGCYDPALFETTPNDLLAGSAMNGFDKGIETLYSPDATPITDGTATRGLSLMARSLPELRAPDRSEDALDDVVAGTILVQYGISRPGTTTLSIIHAFGHGLREGAGVQQGVGHAIVVPHVLRYVFEAVDGRRDLMARALAVDGEGGPDPGADPASFVVDRVTEIRDALDLPDSLRSIDGLARDDLPGIARLVAEDRLIAATPEGLDVTAEDAEAVLESAW